MEDIIREKYKIEYELRTNPDYTAFRAVNIVERDKNTYLLNVYSNESVKKYVKIFHDLKNCPEFKETFVYKGKLAAVFEYKSGEDINAIFKRKAALEVDYRIKSVEQMLNIGLISESFPDDIKCRIINHENFMVRRSSEEITLNFIIDPEVYNKSYVDTLISEIRKMLPMSFTEPIIEREFFLLLKRNPVKDAIELYARWKKIKAALVKEYNRQVSMPIIERIFSIIFQNIKWIFTSRFIGRKKK